MKCTIDEIGTFRSKMDKMIQKEEPGCSGAVKRGIRVVKEITYKKYTIRIRKLKSALSEQRSMLALLSLATASPPAHGHRSGPVAVHVRPLSVIAPEPGPETDDQVGPSLLEIAAKLQQQVSDPALDKLMALARSGNHLAVFEGLRKHQERPPSVRALSATPKTDHFKTGQQLFNAAGEPEPDLNLVKELVRLWGDRTEVINWADEHSQTPLYVAASRGNHEVIRALATSKVLDVNCQTTSEGSAGEGGRTPLYIAARNQRVLAVQALLDIRGLDVNRPANTSWTPLRAATDGARASLGARPLSASSQEIVRMLEARGGHR